MDEPNPYEAPTHSDRQRTPPSPTTSALRAALQACLLAVPVVVFGFYGTRDTLPHRVRMRARVHVGHETILHETIQLAAMWLAVLGVWLGCAAYVGWKKGLAHSQASARGESSPPDEPPPVQNP